MCVCMCVCAPVGEACDFRHSIHIEEVMRSHGKIYRESIPGRGNGKGEGLECEGEKRRGGESSSKGWGGDGGAGSLWKDFGFYSERGGKALEGFRFQHI